jgi:hypothetical protein
MMEMEKRYSDGGDLIITMDEDTVVRMRKDGNVIIRQSVGGDTERVYITVGELKKLLELMKEDEEEL